ncbi:hypothetical protein [Nocardia seriolae]|uniref:Uncharacterized protein n=1 Tax=Nocardia seriolae TaxID=37332 RepID=A0A0B8N704_9NOCA|nr:hypothetical protein [Nocardia seriolae]APB01065.1 hypothetical protein NS506_07038 [Nocardia seriolae]MTJ65591.1 hypothetical protein [Nocardia seriolae]MTJ72762.1 hypothetical protein [Nocardia seriolae]MTJ90468.1 hypothetical protein [Nocardia seriolae]MTK34428.1 hypothetical protein [Nocardia seriolae]
MKRITRNIDLAEARDLLENVPRACLAFTGEQGPQAEPVTVLFEGDRYLVGIPSSAAGFPAVGDEVVLLVDAGSQFFDLRAVYMRGHVEPMSGIEHLARGFLWYALQPARAVAWDYGRMREAEDES